MTGVCGRRNFPAHCEQVRSGTPVGTGSGTRTPSGEPWQLIRMFLIIASATTELSHCWESALWPGVLRKLEIKREPPPAAAPPRAEQRPAHPHLALVALMVFASGCAALVFQIAWMRELRLVFGATTAATAAVLAIFMAGLGIGSAVLGKVADRVANPLRMYGLLEVAIALSAAVTPWLIGLSQLDLSEPGRTGIAGGGWGDGDSVAAGRGVMAVPTVLMGGTLPAAVRSVTRTTDVHRRALGVLYGSNTLGAVFGSAIATFFALEHARHAGHVDGRLCAGLSGWRDGGCAVAHGLPPLTAENRRTDDDATRTPTAMPQAANCRRRAHHSPASD